MLIFHPRFFNIEAAGVVSREDKSRNYSRFDGGFRKIFTRANHTATDRPESTITSRHIDHGRLADLLYVSVRGWTSCVSLKAY